MAWRWQVMVVVVVVVAVAEVQHVAKGDSETLTKGHQDPGEPLFLTKLLKAGKTEAARRMSQIQLGHTSVQSHSGFLTVSQEHSSNLFFWFFTAEEGSEEAPVVVWLEGGPGISSLFSLFNQHGPFTLDAALKPLPRDYSWTKTLNMLYIDAPVGAGFSFTGHEDAYASDAAAVARDLHEALTQFLQVFAEFRHNDVYVAGIAEGGKHAAALAVHIHDENSQAAFKINLKGIAIGNGAQDPSRLTDHGELFYHLSFFDEEERDYFKEQTDLVVSLVVQKKWLEALEVRQRLLGGGLYPSFFVNVSRFHNLINTVEDYPPLDLDRWEEFVALPEVRRELHLGGHTLQDPAVVRRHLREETMRSVEPWIVKLLENNYRVLLYNGQLDLTFPYFATENMVSAMKWSRADEYFEAPRRPWRVRGRVMGYEKSAGGLMRVMVRNAGLLAGRDQPLWTFAMINTFMREKVFT